jgi:hypothetical protein
MDNIKTDFRKSVYEGWRQVEETRTVSSGGFFVLAVLKFNVSIPGTKLLYAFRIVIINLCC